MTKVRLNLTVDEDLVNAVKRIPKINISSEVESVLNSLIFRQNPDSFNIDLELEKMNEKEYLEKIQEFQEKLAKTREKLSKFREVFDENKRKLLEKEAKTAKKRQKCAFCGDFLMGKIYHWEGKIYCKRCFMAGNRIKEI